MKAPTSSFAADRWARVGGGPEDDNRIVFTASPNGAFTVLLRTFDEDVVDDLLPFC